MSSLLSFIFLILTPVAFGSIGDNSGYYQKCLSSERTYCKNGVFDRNQTLYMKVLGWDCLEESKYTCMWKTVQVFRHYHIQTPQFYGKWPFVRIYGLQEPASVLFSITNGIFNLIGFKSFINKVPSNSPLYFTIRLQFLVATNAWFWSSVFHARDFPLTEKLDYFSATSLVIFSLYYALSRIIHESNDEEKIRSRCSFYANILSILFISHISYLTFNKFDYRYNMQMNLTIGFINSICWIYLFITKYQTNRYFWKILAAVICTNCFLTFELFDFPPIYWLIDAHSIWHLLTTPLPLLFYSFSSDDCLYLLKTQKSSHK